MLVGKCPDREMSAPTTSFYPTAQGPLLPASIDRALTACGYKGGGGDCDEEGVKTRKHMESIQE